MPKSYEMSIYSQNYFAIYRTTVCDEKFISRHDEFAPTLGCTMLMPVTHIVMF